jgi:hypothetical protein
MQGPEYNQVSKMHVHVRDVYLSYDAFYDICLTNSTSNG